MKCVRMACHVSIRDVVDMFLEICFPRVYFTRSIEYDDQLGQSAARMNGSLARPFALCPCLTGLTFCHQRGYIADSEFK
jgi:hypothetical protein